MTDTTAVTGGRRHRWHRRFRHSLGMRLVVLFVVLAVAMTMTFAFGMQKALAGGWREVVRPLVADYVDRLAGDLGSPPDVARAQALVQGLPLSIRIEGPTVQWDSHPQRRHRDWRRNGDEPDQDGFWWLLTRSTADGHRIHFGLGDASWQRSPRFIGWLTLVTLLMLTALAYAYVRRMLRPLSDIRAGAVRFGQGDFSRPIASRRDDELGDLAGQVNQMAAGLHGMLDAKRALLLAISHELRSPLTRARLNAELVADTADNREPRLALLRDLSEMRDLVTDLLESERLTSGHAALQPEPLDLNVLAADLLAAHFEGRSVRAELAPGLPKLPLDGMRIKLLLRNLIDNALRHGGEGTAPPLVTTSFNGKMATLTVRDFGPGVAPEHLPKLADAFYRVDAARQRSTGGVGLGLHLCRLVAQAHGGGMEIRNAQPGLVVEVTLPIHEQHDRLG